jgi:hypothetical protein
MDVSKAVLNKLKNNEDFIKACDFKRKKNKRYDITIFTDYEGKNFDVWPRVELHVLDEFPLKIDTVLKSRKELLETPKPKVVNKPVNIREEIFSFMPKEFRITDEPVKTIKTTNTDSYWNKNKEEINKNRRIKYNQEIGKYNGMTPKRKNFDKKEHNKSYYKKNQNDLKKKALERYHKTKKLKTENK